MNTKTILASLASVLAIGFGTTLFAAEKASTSITVDGMHCPSCAKKLVAKLKVVPGVASVTADVNAAQMQVTATAGKGPSPKALWEAVETAGYKTVKLEGPSGTFTAKPKSY